MSIASHSLSPGRSEKIARSLVLLYVTLLVIVPLLALVYAGFADGLGVFAQRVTAPVAVDALGLPLSTALLVAVIMCSRAPPPPGCSCAIPSRAARSFRPSSIFRSRSPPSSPA